MFPRLLSTALSFSLIFCDSLLINVPDMELQDSSFAKASWPFLEHKVLNRCVPIIQECSQTVSLGSGDTSHGFVAD